MKIEQDLTWTYVVCIAVEMITSMTLTLKHYQTGLIEIVQPGAKLLVCL